MGSRMDSEGWTVVRHGRGRLPSRRRVQQGTSGRRGGMDRAPSGPFRDRTQSHIPKKQKKLRKTEMKKKSIKGPEWQNGTQERVGQPEEG